MEEIPCDTGKACPIPGGFGPWSGFGQCSVPCGIGEQIRRRECDSPMPLFGGPPCEGLVEEKRVCDTGIPCPIDGGWSLWGELTICSVKCGSGVQRRERLCNSPLPQFGGANCIGPAFEEVVCDTGVKCVIDGDWGPWSDFKPCSATCGLGTKRRIRECNNPIPMHGGQECVGFSFEEKPCATGIPCAIHGEWGMWSAWPACSVTCGSEIITRTRQCDSPPPQYGGAFCVGHTVEETVCETKVSCPVHGHWSAWSLWSVCAATCGMGSRQRQRMCNNPLPMHGGSSCEGIPLEKDACNTGIPCPIAGGWSLWIVLEPCNVKCGAGLGKRTRECNNPPPQFGGPDCIGPNTEIFDCDTGIPCPINGEWSLWGIWTKCSVGCGEGIVHRKRSCANPPPQYNGLPCVGPEVEKRPCDSGIPCPVDGHWSLWSSWTACSDTCGKGVSVRKRICDSPAPLYGGIPCDGPNVDKITCDSGIPCPIDGVWSAWGILSACSVTCGTGFIIKTRICDSPPPQFGGRPCQGINKKEIVCDTGVSCPINGMWGPWAEFSKCSESCGAGTITRTRACDSPLPTFGGLMCVGDFVEKQPCDTGMHCPIPGGWTAWSPFTPCSKTCGIGTQRRMRRCMNPAPAFGGLDCIGFADEERKCETGINCAIDGNWSLWGKWGKCSAMCGVGIQQRTRICNNPPPLYGGGDCFGSPIGERECKTGVFCPIDGGWGKWSKYSVCNVKCGIGVQKRFRKCDSPMPKFGGLDCKGHFEEEIPCDTKVHCPVNGHWTSWLAWEPCSVPCGVGNTKRFRECSNPLPMYGGLPCPGPKFEKKVCDTGINCPVPGGWSMWGEFIPCSVTCGFGVTQRTRICDNPLPMYGGEPCIGKIVESKKCDSGVLCPINGGFSLWSKWSLCSAKCGKGVRTRTRLCDSPKSMYGGADCVGEFVQEEMCMADIHCPIHGFWSIWTHWSKCSAICGKGVQERERVCNSPTPMYGGRQCQGENIDIIPCVADIPCPVNGGWSIWTLWSTCSVSCGEGKWFKVIKYTDKEYNFDIEISPHFSLVATVKIKNLLPVGALSFL